LNPRSADDPVDRFFRGLTPPTNAIIRKINYTDNPWFPAELEDERQHDLRTNPERSAHIWLGEYEPMVVGAIWNRQNLHAYRRSEVPPDIERIVVSVDHAVSAEEHSDEHGIIVAGRAADKRAYVLEDATLKGTPRQWGERAVAMFDKWDADAIVIERNQGGDLIRQNLRTIRPNVPVVEVVASKGKHVRAEPIASMYAVGQVSHIGTFDRLENEMCQMTAAGFEGTGSPNRCDALVWAITELMPSMVRHGKRRETRVENCSNYDAL
jgi:phage terminase large subunit-like protein